MATRISRLSTLSSFYLTGWQWLIYLLLLLPTISSCDDQVGKAIVMGDWRRRSDFEGAARTAAASFTIGSYAYVGTGADRNNNQLNDFWVYDQTRNAWLQLADFPGPKRSGAVGFSIGNKGYVGLGIDQSGNRLKDFYEYTPTTDFHGPGTWRRVADFGGTARASAVAFAIGGLGYVGFGDDLNSTTDMWAYNAGTNTWQKKATYTGSARVGAVAFAIGDVAYVGTGTNNGTNLNDWWAYNPAQDIWLKKPDLPKDPIVPLPNPIQSRGGVGFVINGKGYVSQSNPLTNAVWEYDPTNDRWTARAGFEGANRQNSVGFSLGAKGYITTGGGSGSPYDDLWEFDPTVPQD